MGKLKRFLKKQIDKKLTNVTAKLFLSLKKRGIYKTTSRDVPRKKRHIFDLLFHLFFFHF